MSVPRIFESEYRFCLILRENEPIRSTALAKLCGETPPIKLSVKLNPQQEAPPRSGGAARMRAFWS